VEAVRYVKKLKDNGKITGGYFAKVSAIIANPNNNQAEQLITLIIACYDSPDDVVTALKEALPE
jgi:hypothetical protein